MVAIAVIAIPLFAVLILYSAAAISADDREV